MESLAERKAREAKMKEDYERKLREIDEKRNAGVSHLQYGIGCTFGHLFQPDDFNKVCQVSCMNVASLVAF